MFTLWKKIPTIKGIKDSRIDSLIDSHVYTLTLLGHRSWVCGGGQAEKNEWPLINNMIITNKKGQIKTNDLIIKIIFTPV